MQCPRCTIYLDEHVHKDVKFYSCPDCDGLWFLKKDLKRAKRPDFTPAVLTEADGPEVVHRDVGQAIRCPVGGHAPLKRVFTDYVHVDVCEEHKGVWLDGGELKEMKTDAGGSSLAGDFAGTAIIEGILKVLFGIFG